jgi:hypothetical protein
VKNNFTELFDVIDHLTNFSFDLIDEYCSIEAGTQKVLSADIYANEDIPFYNYEKVFEKKTRIVKISVLDKYSEEIKGKINLPGATITEWI